jgi:transitional endoplasmic reticulum ATPase
MAPDRTRLTSEAVSGEVNEFLSQLNNCSDRGIFVIGTTNRPNMIDPAIIRSGRMDHMVYIPMPDLEARKDLFRIHLDGRPCDDDIDICELAGITEGYVASDIELVVNKAALASAKRDLPISQKLLEEIVAMTHRSVSESDRLSYDDMYRQMVASHSPRERRRIGFLTATNK